MPVTHVKSKWANGCLIFSATNDGISGTSYEPVRFNTTMTGAGQVGGRIMFYTTANVALGGWANALKAHFNFGSSGRITGLASAACVEMDLPNANLGMGGAYFPLEIELNPGASTVSQGAATGNHVGFITMSVNTNKADFNDNGFIFTINGLTAGDNDVFEASDINDPDFTHSLRIAISGVPYYIGLSTSPNLDA